MNDQIENIITEISAIEDTGIQLKLRDKNKKSLGSFFKKKKDGASTVAYDQYLDMGIESGSVVEISFKEVPYKDGTIKNIIGFREAAGRPESNYKARINGTESADAQALKEALDDLPLLESEFPNAKPQGQDKFGQRLAVHGLLNGLLASGNYLPEEINDKLIKDVIALEDRINEALL